MKKFLLCLFSLLFISTASIGGGLIFAGCNQTHFEDTGGGFDDFENGNEEELPSDEEENEDVEANSINFTVRVRAYTCDNYGVLSYSSLNSKGIYAGKFSISWHEGDGGWGNGDDKTWGKNNVPSKTAATGYSVTGGGGSDTRAGNLVYFHYEHGNYQRYGKLTINTGSGFALWGVSTSSSFPSSRDSTSTKYIYGNGSTVNSEPRGTGTTMSGTWYVNFRQEMKLQYDANGGTGAPSTTTFYAGNSVTLSSSVPTRPGYKFDGWVLNGTTYNKGSSVSWSDLVGDSTTVTATAMWVPVEMEGSWTDSGNYSTSWSGNGTSSSPYLISNEKELAGLAYRVNNGTNYEGKYFKLTSNLDLSEHYWTPIGYSSYSFNGNLDGDGHIISFLYTEYQRPDYQGLFGVVGSYSSTITPEIKNIGIEKSSVRGYRHIGGFIGSLIGNVTIKNCYFSGEILAGSYVGGIVGYCTSYSSKIQNCYNLADIQATGKYVGGILGQAPNEGQNYIINCFNTGSIKGNNYVGGIAGYTWMTQIINCFNTGSVDAIEDSNVYESGIVGYFYYNMPSKCYYGGDCTLSYGAGGTNSGTTKITSLDSTSYAKGKSWFTNSSNWNTSYKWDFTNTFAISSYFNDGYPYLLGFDYDAPNNMNEFWSDHYSMTWGGSGTQESPYQITSEEQLAGLAYYVNSNTKYSGDNYFELTTDLDMSEYWWDPIGTNANEFQGVFDGNGHTISGIYTDKGLYQGLFGYVTGSSTKSSRIKNVNVVDSKIQGSASVGGIVGKSEYLSIENCSFQGIVECYDDTGEAGGIAGSFAKISYCENYGDVWSESSYVGGIVGRTTEEITNCVNYGKVTGRSYIGGAVGYSASDVQKCSNYGRVAGAESYIGGVVGYITSSGVYECSNFGDVYGSGGIGGVIGSQYGNEVRNCYNFGDVISIGDQNNSQAGGIVGYINYYAIMSNCYNTGSVEIAQFSGGIAGYADTIYIYNCFNTGEVSATVSYMGGIAGYDYGYASSSINNCYFGGDCSAIYGSGGPSLVTGSNTATKIPSLNTTSYAKSKSWFTNSSNWYSPSSYGWDFNDVWFINSYFNEGYPILLWEIPVYEITLDQQGGSGGTEEIFLKYYINFYPDERCENAPISDVTTPNRLGHTFLGYYTLPNGQGTQIIDASGEIVGSNRYTNEDDILYAAWEVNQHYFDVNVFVNDVEYATGIEGFTFDVYRESVLVESNIRNYSKYEYYNTEMQVDVNSYRQGYHYDRMYCKNWNTTVETETITVRMADASTVVNIYFYSDIYEITLKYGNDKTDTKLYLKYDVGYFTDETCINSATQITKPTRTGYIFGGFFTEENGEGTKIIDDNGIIVGPNNAFLADSDIYAYWIPKNEGKYDEENGYWYVEMGYFPQTKVIDSDLKSNIQNNGTATGGSYYIAGQTLMEYEYDNAEYALYNGEYYKVEPVRYILSGEYSIGDATEGGKILAVSEKIVFASVFQTGWTVNDCLGKGYNDAEIKNNVSGFIETSYMESDYLNSETYSVANFSKIVTDEFGNKKLINSSSDITTQAIASNESEIQSVFGDLSAEFSDLVADLLGGYLFYWTRDVGSNLLNAQTISAKGTTGTQMKMSELLGVRITININTLVCP